MTGYQIYSILNTWLWSETYKDFRSKMNTYNDYNEVINFSYRIHPLNGYYMSNKSNLFIKEKARAVYYWYKNKDSRDHSIEQYFDEYKRCTDESHPDFNSNYGLYAYSENGLDKCIERLAKDNMTRQAMFCINNNEAMSDRSIDKLCTNTVHFFIRNNKLIMNVNMRASNFITLLPYDSFMFCFWYFYVYNKLYIEHNMTNLKIDYINMNVSTIHFYDKNLDNIVATETDESIEGLFNDYQDKDFISKFEYKLNNK